MLVNILFSTLGGLGLFLFGMHMMSDGLQKLAGPRMRSILDRFTTNRVIALLAGTFITSVVQSSSATTVMTVGLVNAGLMGLKQAIGVVLGANIGTTVTAQIIAFKLTDYALPVIGIGMLMKLLGRTEKTRYWGDALLGFGMLFYGLFVMKQGMEPMRDAPWVNDLFVHFSRTPIPGIIVGTLITMLFQSSSATIGLVIALASSGVVGFYGSAALVLGDNIGTTITAELAAIRTNVSAKRVARAHTMFNVIGVCIILIIFPWFVRFVDFVTPGDPNLAVNGGVPYIARHIANFHTLFNVTNNLLFLPLLGVLARIVTTLVPGEEELRKFRLESLDPSILETVSVALDEAKKEVDYMGGEVYNMLTSVEESLLDNKDTDTMLERVKGMEDTVDLLQKEINTYLTELSRSSATEKESKEIFSLLYMVSNLERIGDHCESIAKLCKRKKEFSLVFSEAGLKELSVMYRHTLTYLKTIIDAIQDTPLDLMDRIKGYETRLNEMRVQLRINHMERLKTATCGADAGLIYVDMLTSFEKIGDHAFNIAESLSGIK
ncbi:MAG: Na/Pi cotransporter family protein [Thermodesulfobacteriota bacterium]|nr:Na/Pi cotransporter family protein [Thermodesulfobacteriota bacterium]